MSCLCMHATGKGQSEFGEIDGLLGGGMEVCISQWILRMLLTSRVCFTFLCRIDFGRWVCRIVLIRCRITVCIEMEGLQHAFLR